MLLWCLNIALANIPAIFPVRFFVGDDGKRQILLGLLKFLGPCAARDSQALLRRIHTHVDVAVYTLVFAWG
jgi:hypothetical protein